MSVMYSLARFDNRLNSLSVTSNRQITILSMADNETPTCHYSDSLNVCTRYRSNTIDGEQDPSVYNILKIFVFNFHYSNQKI